MKFQKPMIKNSRRSSERYRRAFLPGFVLFCLFFFSGGIVRAQSGFFPRLDARPDFSPFRPLPLASGVSSAASLPAEEDDGTIFAGKPQWVRDLRRAEIITFGSFPFTVFFTATFMDLYRSASHGWDRRYAPWPAKAAGAVSMTEGELKAMFGIAAAASVLIAVSDYLIVRYRRSRVVKEEPAFESVRRRVQKPGPPEVDENEADGEADQEGQADEEVNGKADEDGEAGQSPGENSPEENQADTGTAETEETDTGN